MAGGPPSHFPRSPLWWRAYDSTEAVLGTLPVTLLVPTLAALAGAAWAVGHPSLVVHDGLVEHQASFGSALVSALVAGVLGLLALVALVFIATLTWYRLRGDGVWKVQWRFGAEEHLPGGSPSSEPLRRALDSLGCVVRDGRDAVQGLRLHQRDDIDLDQAFSRMARDITVRDQTAYRVVVEGNPMPLHPMVRDEIYSIGREAVINAFRHSAATEIIVQIGYSRDCLCVTVRDDGCGIDPQILHSGRAGHWGLVGMRERAGRIDAQFSVQSGAARGTEIRLMVPGRTAFSRMPENGRARWFARQILRGKGHR